MQLGNTCLTNEELIAAIRVTRAAGDRKQLDFLLDDLAERWWAGRARKGLAVPIEKAGERLDQFREYYRILRHYGARRLYAFIVALGTDYGPADAIRLVLTLLAAADVELVELRTAAADDDRAPPPPTPLERLTIHALPAPPAPGVARVRQAAA